MAKKTSNRRRLADYGDFDKSQVVSSVLEFAKDSKSKSLEVVASRIADLPEWSCTINEPTGILDNFLEKWTEKFVRDWENRASQRTSNPTGTKHDPILDEIISARLPDDSYDIAVIRYGHRLSMGADNITGSLLEEFIAFHILSYGWHACWGETMRSIDFCHENGQLLQIKNSDNSENSSSKTVRDGTKIKHWFRRFSRTGETNWPKLNELAGIEDEKKQLTEEAFKEFVKRAISTNPGSIYLEESSPWYGLEDT